MNRIIKRIAAFYDEKGQINNDINQEKSNSAYNYDNDALDFLHTIYDEYVSQMLKDLYYKTNEIGKYGKSLIINNNKIVVEWQVKPISEYSIVDAYETLNDFCDNNSISSTQHDKIVNQFDNYVDEKYYCGKIVVFINGNQNNQYYHCQYFPKNTSNDELRNIGKDLVNKVLNTIKNNK